jgi:hypothetical protein
MIDPGMPRVLSLTTTSTGAGSTTVPLRPDDGKQWVILFAVGYHADAAGVVCDWVYQDPDSGGAVGLAGSGLILNPAVLQPIGAITAGGPTQLLSTVKATRGRYPTFVFVASAINKVGYVRALVWEYKGLLDG